MEVLHGNIRITLTDEDAIRGVERIHTTVKREMKAIGREKAVVNIEGDLRKLRRDLKEADALAEAHQSKIQDLTAKSDSLSGKEKAAAQKRIDAEQAALDALNERVKASKEEEKRVAARLDSYKRLNREAKFEERQTKVQEKAESDLGKIIDNNIKKRQTEGQLHARALREDRERSARIQDDLQKEGFQRRRAMREMEAEFAKRAAAEHQAQEDIQKAGFQRRRAAREMETDFAKRETNERKMHSLQLQALRDDSSREASIARLQQEYDKASQSFQRLTKRRTSAGGRLREAASPEIKQRVELQQALALGEMEALRAKLELMGRKPIDIATHLDDRTNVLAKIADIGDIGTRIGPFSGTLLQFAKAAALLGPILIGLVGYIGGLAGAIGTGLTGALGLASSALAGFGLSLGGVAFLTASLFRDFKNLNTLQKAYHVQVLKTGANSDKAKKKLAEFNHALGEVTPTTRAAFMTLDKLQDRWRGLRKAVRPEFMATMGEAIKTVNADFQIFSSRTQEAFGAVTGGLQKWFRGLRSVEGQSILDTLMGNTNKAIPPLMNGLGHIGAAFGRMAASFSRFFAPLAREFDRWAKNVDEASQHTDALDRGTGRLYHSFHQVWGVVVALSRVLAQFALTAMGPGGKMLDNLSGGLNGIADSIRADRLGDNKLGKFLSESADTTDRLYHAVLPLFKLFLEFSTILRPWTDALLNMATAVGDVTASFAGWGPFHSILQGMAALWLFNRGTATTISLVAGGINAVAAALRATGFAAAGIKLTGAASRILGQRTLPATVGAAEAAGGGAVSGATAKKIAASKGVIKTKTESAAAGAVAGSTFASRMGYYVAAGIAAWKLSDWLQAKFHGAMNSVGGIPDLFPTRANTALANWLANLFGNVQVPPMANKLSGSISSAVEIAQRRVMAARLGIQIDLKIKSEQAKRAMDEVMNQIDRTRRGMATSLAGAASDAEMNMKLIRNSLNIHSAQGKSAVAANFRAVAASIRSGIKSGAIDTEKGMAAIHGYLMRALQALGIKGRANQEGYLGLQDFRRNNSGTGTGRGGAATGYIGAPGERGRDVVPLLVGAGEAVINRHQQQYVNAGLAAIGMTGGLPELFQREQTPHYMNQGGFTKASSGFRKRLRTGAGPRETELGQAAAGKPINLPRYMTRQGGLLGQVTQASVDTYHKAAQAKARKAQEQIGGVLGMGKGAAVRQGGALARALGLMVTSTTGGHHVANSWHYKGRAVDVSGSPGDMMQFFRQASARWGRNILELFYDPAGWYIKNGHKVTGAIGDTRTTSTWRWRTAGSQRPPRARSLPRARRVEHSRRPPMGRRGAASRARALPPRASI
jgi:hypothetical protein